MAQLKIADSWYFSSTGELNRHDYMLPNDATHFFRNHNTRERKPQVGNESVIPNTPGFKSQRVRNTPTWSSSMSQTDGFDRYDVRKGCYVSGPAPQRPTPLPPKEVEPVPKFKPARRMNCHPYGNDEPRKAINAAETEKFSHNANFYARDGYQKWSSQKCHEMGPLKVTDPNGYYGPTPRHLPNPNKYEKPNDFTVTLEATNVGGRVDSGVLERGLADQGLNIMASNFKHNPITNKRDGKGVLHVRVKNEQELQRIENACETNGMNVTASNNYKPVWNRY